MVRPFKLIQQRQAKPNNNQDVEGVSYAEMEKSMTNPSDKNNVGHGHVFPRADGSLARCGGPAICDQCSRDAARKLAAETIPGRLAAFKEAIEEIQGWMDLHEKMHATTPYADKKEADREHGNVMNLLAVIRSKLESKAGLKPDLSLIRKSE